MVDRLFTGPAEGEAVDAPAASQARDRDGDDRAFQFVLSTARTEIDAVATDFIDRTIDGLDWPRTLALGRFHRVLPLMHWSLSRYFPARVPEEESECLQGWYRQSAIINLAFANEMANLHGMLNEKGIECIGFKGPAFAEVAYSNLGLRACADIDLLIPAGAFDAAQALLEGRGYRLSKHVGELGGWRRRWYLGLSGQAAFARGQSGFVDLHVAVMPPGYRFEDDFSKLYSRSVIVPLGASEVRTFGPVDQLLIMSLHGVKNRWEGVKHLADIAEFVRSHPDLDWQAVVDRSREMHAQRIVRLSLSLAHRLLGAPLPDVVLEWIATDRKMDPLSTIVAQNMAHAHERALSPRDRFRFHLHVQETLRTKAAYLLYVLERRLYDMRRDN